MPLAFPIKQVNLGFTSTFFSFSPSAQVSSRPLIVYKEPSVRADFFRVFSWPQDLASKSVGEQVGKFSSKWRRAGFQHAPGHRVGLFPTSISSFDATSLATHTPSVETRARVFWVGLCRSQASQLIQLFPLSAQARILFPFSQTYPACRYLPWTSSPSFSENLTRLSLHHSCSKTSPSFLIRPHHSKNLAGLQL